MSGSRLFGSLPGAGGASDLDALRRMLARPEVLLVSALVREAGEAPAVFACRPVSGTLQPVEVVCRPLPPEEGAGA